MKKLVLAVLLTVTTCGAAFAASQITAEGAFITASKPNDDPIVGVWRMYPRSGGYNKVAHMAIVPNTTNKRQNWSYLGIMLEDGFQIKKNGIKIALKQTSSAGTYKVILSNRASKSGALYVDGGGFASLRGAFLSMSRVEVPYVNAIFDDYFDRYAPISYMIKVRDFQMETIKFNLSGLSFDGLKIETVEPGSFADKAGLRPSDVIVEINGKTVDEGTLENIDARLAAGRFVILTYERDGNKDIVTLK